MKTWLRIKKKQKTKTKTFGQNSNDSLIQNWGKHNNWQKNILFCFVFTNPHSSRFFMWNLENLWNLINAADRRQKLSFWDVVLETASMLSLDSQKDRVSCLKLEKEPDNNCSILVTLPGVKEAIWRNWSSWWCGGKRKRGGEKLRWTDGIATLTKSKSKRMEECHQNSSKYSGMNKGTTTTNFDPFLSFSLMLVTYLFLS